MRGIGFHSRAIDQKQIEIPIAIVVEKSGPRRHRFEDIALLCAAGDLAKIEANSLGHIDELHFGCRCFDLRFRLAPYSQHQAYKPHAGDPSTH